MVRKNNKRRSNLLVKWHRQYLYEFNRDYELVGKIGKDDFFAIYKTSEPKGSGQVWELEYWRPNADFKYYWGFERQREAKKHAEILALKILFNIRAEEFNEQ